MTIYIYSNETGKQVDAIEGRDSLDCETKAAAGWSTNDFHFSYLDVPVSNAA